MARGLFFVVAAVCGLLAAVGDARADEWTGRDKTMHAIGGALVAGSVHELTGSRWAGFAAGAAVGIGKELYDMRTPRRTPSIKDAVVTIAGASLVAVRGLRIGPGWITYRKEW